MTDRRTHVVTIAWSASADDSVEPTAGFLRPSGGRLLGGVLLEPPLLLNPIGMFWALEVGEAEEEGDGDDAEAREPNVFDSISRSTLAAILYKGVGKLRSNASAN